jgi:hypothetical protein
VGILERGRDGIYRHVRGRVPWADNALDRIAERDRMDVLERDGKPWTVADIDRLERERDDYKDRWETLGRVSKRMIETRDEQLRGAVPREKIREALDTVSLLHDISDGALDYLLDALLDRGSK